MVTMITETLNWIHDLPVAATDKPRSYYKMHSIHAYIIHKIHIWFTFSPMFKYHNMMKENINPLVQNVVKNVIL